MDIVGSWEATSTLNGDPLPYSTTFVYHQNHTVEAIGPGFSGRGHWIDRPDGTIVFHVEHPVPDHNGGPDIGKVFVIQQVRILGETHSGNGTAVMELADGTVQKPVSVSLEAKRVIE